MKFVSHFALIGVLATAVTATSLVAPAAAQKKKKEEAAPQLKLSEAVRKPILAAQEAIKVKDDATARTQIAAAEAVATTDDERYAVSSVKLSIVAQDTDRTVLLSVLDALVNNPRTPAADLPRLTYFRGAIPYEMKKYSDALPFLLKARDLGYPSTDMALQIAQSYVETGNVPAGVAELDKAITAEEAAGKKAPQDWYNYAVAKLYAAGQNAETAKWLQRSVKAYPTAQNWRKVIIVYRDAHERKGGAPLDRGQKMDLYRLMRASKALADQTDYIEYADLAYQAGLPYETKALIEEGRATGKVPATYKMGNELYTLAQAAIAKDTPLATLEKQAASAATGKAVSSSADVFLANGNYAKAAELYRIALQKGGVDVSEANLRLGQALAQSGDAAGAKAAFALVTAAPRSEIAGFWTQWLELAPSMTGD
jgi:hypothetical protein